MGGLKNASRADFDFDFDMINPQMQAHAIDRLIGRREISARGTFSLFLWTYNNISQSNGCWAFGNHDAHQQSIDCWNMSFPSRLYLRKGWTFLIVSLSRLIRRIKELFGVDCCVEIFPSCLRQIEQLYSVSWCLAVTFLMNVSWCNQHDLNDFLHPMYRAFRSRASALLI